jgi:Leucine-rich repeat (LRR) protein
LLSKNRLRHLPSSFSRLLSLSILRADVNEIHTLGFQVQKLPMLHQLRLGRNRLTDAGLPLLIGRAPSLTDLGLSENHLETLPPSLGSTPLKKLALEGNPLKRPPSQLVCKGLVHVQRYLLFLSSFTLIRFHFFCLFSPSHVFTFSFFFHFHPQRYLAALDFATSSCKLDLSRLFLQECPLPLGPTALPAEIGLWQNLRELVLEGNHLAGLPVEICMLPNLVILDMQVARNNASSWRPHDVYCLHTYKHTP